MQRERRAGEIGRKRKREPERMRGAVRDTTKNPGIELFTNLAEFAQLSNSEDAFGPVNWMLADADSGESQASGQDLREVEVCGKRVEKYVW
eukprot:3518634-Pyramimonas_sp.AAC.1